MPKRRNKGRKKRRKPQQQLPRPSRGGDSGQQMSPAAATEQQPTAAAQATMPAPTTDNLGSRPPDRRVTGTVLAVEREFIRIDVDGQEANIYASELMLDVGETPSQRYIVGDRFDAFVFQMEPDPDSGLPQFSIRRASPYPDALNRLEVGAIVNATVVNTYDVGIELDIDGVRGNALFQDLPLALNESPHDRYQPGDALKQLFVWEVDHDARDLYLSMQRNAPGYVEALAAHSVGEVVNGVVTASQGNGGIWLDVDGVIGDVLPQELGLADGQSVQERYAVGDTVNDLFVWQVNHDARGLNLSVRRNVPTYVEALAARSVGDIVSGVVTGVPGNGGIWLDVDGVIGGMPPHELSVADSQSAQERYPIGDTVSDLFVWQVNHDARDLYLSVRRNAPSYVETLNARSVGEVVSGVVTDFQSNGGLLLNVNGIIGSVPPWELPLADGETLQERYPIDAHVHDLFVCQVHHNARDLALSVRRSAPSYVEALNAHSVGEIVDGVVTSFPGNSGLLLNVNGIIGSVPPWELPLADGETLQERYPIDAHVHDLFVCQVHHNARDLALSVRRSAPSYVEALNAHSVGEIVDGVVTSFPGNSGLLLNVNGIIGSVPPWELPLADGETLQERYPIDAHVHDLFVCQVHHDARDLYLSVRRSAPAYVEALNAHSVGEIVDGVVTSFPGNSGLLLNVNGIIGSVPPWELPLADGETLQERYPIDAHVHDLFVCQVHHNARDLALSVRRSAPSYVEALNAHSVGEIVDGVVTSFPGNSGLLLNVNGIIGSVPPWELPLADGETLQERYPIDAHVHDLFVCQVHHNARDLALSVRRSAPSYVEALDPHSVGEAVSGVVTGFADKGGLWLDVDGVIGGVPPWELPLADGETVQERYPIGEPVRDLFVWQVDHNQRRLGLSVRRNTHDYVDALAARGVGEDISGVVIDTNEWGIWLDTDGVVGWIPASELAPDEGESPRDHYADGDTVAAHVWQIDQISRTVILSVRRLHADFIEDPFEPDETVLGIYLNRSPGGIRVLVADSDLYVPRCELSLSVGDRPPFGYGQPIPLVVLAVDSNGQPTKLSHRRALSNWQAEVNRLIPGVIVQNAEIIPVNALPPGAGEDRTGVDLGPVTGFVDHAELGADDARAMMLEEANTQYSVVIESIDADGEAPIVSNDKFEERWRELAENVSEGDQVQAELRHVSHDNATLDLDLGSGLLATMPADQLPTTETPAKPHIERIGETFSVLVTRKDESARAITVEHRDQPIERLIRQGESEKLEFKATLRRSPRTGETDAAATFGVMKSIVGFLNSWDGGTLLVGVNDRGILITGPADEVGTMAIDGFANEDEMVRALKDLIKNRIGVSVFEWLTISFTDFRNSRILRVDCEPADNHVWLKGGKNGKSKEEDFFLRTPAATDPLNRRELVDYIERRFHGARTVDN